MSRPSEAFRGQGRNFMTPHVEGYGYATARDGRRLAYELSTGEGLDREPVWGVTWLVEVSPERWEPVWRQDDSDQLPQSDCYWAFQDAMDAISDVVMPEQEPAP